MATLLPGHAAGVLRPVARHPLTGVLAFLALVLLGARVGPTLALRLGASDLYAGPWAELVTCVAAYLVVVVLLERRRPTELSLRCAGGLAGGLLLGGGLCLVVFGVLWAMGLRRIDAIDPSRLVLWQVVVFGLVAGVSEELAFRGIAYRAAEHWLGTWGATAASGLLFGLLHVTNPQATAWGALSIALSAGVSLALLFRASGSLWWPIGVHASWNAVQGPLLGSAISGATTNGQGLVVSAPVGPGWLSGGAFGLEATPVAVVVWLAVSVALVLRIRRHGLAVPARRPFRRAVSDRPVC